MSFTMNPAQAEQDLFVGDTAVFTYRGKHRRSKVVKRGHGYFVGENELPEGRKFSTFRINRIFGELTVFSAV